MGLEDDIRLRGERLGTHGQLRARSSPGVARTMPSAPDRRLPTGTVTFLFTDIEGSTRLVTALGAGYGPVVEAHATAIRSALADHAGTEVSTEGDAFFAAFPSAVDAVAAAADIPRRLAAGPWPARATRRVPIGLHTRGGHRGGGDYNGIDAPPAARGAAPGAR